MKALATFLFILLSTHAFTQVNWLKWNEAFSQKKDRYEFQLTFILVSTDWCSYCQLQKRKMRKLKIEGIRFVELNAYTQESLYWKDSLFLPSADLNSYHPLLEQLTGKPIHAFPTWMIFDHISNVIHIFEGVLENEVFYQISR